MVKVIGIGGCGLNIINHLTNKYSKISTVCIEEDQLKIDLSKAYENILIDNDLDEKVLYRTQSCRKAVIVAGLGGFVGNNYIVEISESLLRQNIQVEIVIVMPFAWECRDSKANKKLKELKNLDCTLKIFDNNIEINEKLDLNIKKQFKTLDTKICDYIILNLEEYNENI